MSVMKFFQPTPIKPLSFHLDDLTRFKIIAHLCKMPSFNFDVDGNQLIVSMYSVPSPKTPWASPGDTLDVVARYDIPEGLLDGKSDQDLAKLIYDAAVRSLTHEASEWFTFNGEDVFNEHNFGKPVFELK